MTPFVLQHNAEPFDGVCVVCSKLVVLAPGLQLCRGDRKRPVCESCGRRVAPALTALQGLADTAERVARIPSHTLTPPLTALLDLARAAERFSTSACTPVYS